MSAEHWTDRFQGQAEMYGELSDADIATKARMLGRNDLDHEPVVQAARDRIARLSRANRDVTSDNERLTRALSKQSEEVCQILGRALGYPRFCDDQENFPGTTDADGVCVGEHVCETLAAEAAMRIEEAKSENERLARELREKDRRISTLNAQVETAEPALDKLAEAKGDKLTVAGESVAMGDVLVGWALGQIAEMRAEMNRLSAALGKGEHEIVSILLAALGSDAQGARQFGGGKFGNKPIVVIGETAKSLAEQAVNKLAELTAKLAAAENTCNALLCGELQRDRDRLAAELAETKKAEAERRFVCPPVYTHCKKCGRQNDWRLDLPLCPSCSDDADVEAAKGGTKTIGEESGESCSRCGRADTWHPDCPTCRKIVLLEQQLAAANQAREAAKEALAEIWGECCPDCGPQQYELFSGLLSKMIDEQRQRAERAEAAAAVMRTGIEALKKDVAVQSPLWNAYEKLLNADPGRAANELRSARKFIAEVRQLVKHHGTHLAAITGIEQALADYDQASQGEQRGEGR